METSLAPRILPKLSIWDFAVSLASLGLSLRSLSTPTRDHEDIGLSFTDHRIACKCAFLISPGWRRAGVGLLSFGRGAFPCRPEMPRTPAGWFRCRDGRPRLRLMHAKPPPMLQLRSPSPTLRELTGEVVTVVESLSDHFFFVYIFKKLATFQYLYTPPAAQSSTASNPIISLLGPGFSCVAQSSDASERHFSSPLLPRLHKLLVFLLRGRSIS
ncbi:hypothetical protein P154DRAFT_245553 [Amniculicola lignicola CBS 123094]|uniref:Uncharacterized protein n=1 Tax=Amniculicola lignicola CBS 123094 TaxID=1392246 RepID=A0A6A5WHG2_9PLEO|nr:hypothetical protein P154DRAFT_245553 [Amniculicola lignicola CBS 123094]